VLWRQKANVVPAWFWLPSMEETLGRQAADALPLTGCQIWHAFTGMRRYSLGIDTACVSFCLSI
jgi:hypothetical protein